MLRASFRFRSAWLTLVVLFLLIQPESVRAINPLAVDGIVCYWDFHEPAGQDRVAKGPCAYRLQEMGGPIDQVAAGPYGKFAVQLQSGQWFRIPRGDFPALDFHGSDARLTVVAWIKRESNSPWQAVAGVWNETERQRQYCLFVNGGARTDANTMLREPCRDYVHGHVSDVGGSSPGKPFCFTYSTSPIPVHVGQWRMVAMTYDGHHSRAYVDGRFQADQGRNPFPLPRGLFHGTADFTVGAVDRHEEIGNFLIGSISGLAVYSRVLDLDELTSLATAQ
tara:strand:- start:10 stop:846 length:837 start_codon:yes stop_codon:yes gene_type:complete